MKLTAKQSGNPPIRRVRLKGIRALALQSLSFSSALEGGAGVALLGKGEREGGPGFMGCTPFGGGEMGVYSFPLWIYLCIRFLF